MDSPVPAYTCRNSSHGLRMANRKNKKKKKKMIQPLNLYLFPGYYLYFTLVIVVALAITFLGKSCAE